ncbi:MAG: electron transfer flavoprotein subunit alpha [Deltaproteobacteria bacterium]|jgi:electron transfer flavoprotein alpha subunit|nr:MAG: electron transfer flavoprotein subunit alpha [Deltaproteobacteria bacterium]
MTFDNLQEYNGLWVFVEQGDGKPARVSLELLGKGRTLADKLGAVVTAILIGQNVTEMAEELIFYGADRVIIADDPIAKDYRTEINTDIIFEQVLKEKPEILLIGATCIGRDLAPRLSARLNTGCTADCTELDIDKEMRLIVATKPFFGRDLMADIICPFHRPQMVTVRAGVMELKDKDRKREGELIYIDVNLKKEDTKVKVLETIRSVSDSISLEEADKVVAAGMGVGNKEGFEMVKELAKLLGAQVGATSLPVDEGWISDDKKIGQTGKTIRPKLYIGCGVSGAIQHSAGMINSELIIAINTNPKADIFNFADYGIIGDVNQIVPALIKELRIVKG